MHGTRVVFARMGPKGPAFEGFPDISIYIYIYIYIYREREREREREIVLEH
jgi:hypothetical protein